MPLPWKNARVSRISKIVADLQSPNRGNSLVVETGFPTSLVDLFVKNRDRLKKPSKKKKKQRAVEELVISDPIPLSASRDLEFISGPIFVESVDDCRHEMVEEEERGKDFYRCKLVGEDPHLNLIHSVLEERDDGGGGGVCEASVEEKDRRLVVAILKMFVVVLLTLTANRLAVGITMSAFVLIFLEYVAKHFMCFLEPCSNAREALEPLIQRARPFFRVWLVSGEVKNCQDSIKGLIIREGDATDSDSCDLVENLELQPPVEEIEAVACMVTHAEVNMEMETDLESITSDLRSDCAEMEAKVEIAVHENLSGVLTCEKEHSKRAKIRKKIKKLMPKKFRGGKNEKKVKAGELDASSEVCIGGEDTLQDLPAVEDKGNGDKQDIFNKGKPLAPESVEKRAVEKQRSPLVSGLVEERGVEKQRKQNKKLLANVEMTEAEGRLEVGRKSNPVCLILFVIVLVGLAGGRMLALLLTVASCLLFKLSGRSRRCVSELTNGTPASISDSNEDFFLRKGGFAFTQ